MKIKTVTEQEVEVTFPQYRKFGLKKLYQIVNENNYIGITSIDIDSDMSAYEIEVKEGYPSSVAIIYNDGETVDKACFDNAFQKALSHINQQMFMAATQPATEQDKLDEEIFINEIENVGI